MHVKTVISGICIAIALCTVAYSQQSVASSQGGADVLVLSLASVTDMSGHREHVREQLTGAAHNDLHADILDMQMDIVRKSAAFGPVVLLAPDEETKTAIYRLCHQYDTCELFRSDKVRMKVVSHEGVWIRDFGPQIEIQNGLVRVVHWRYFDNRAEESRTKEIQNVNLAILQLIAHRLSPESDEDVYSGEQDEDSDSNPTEADRKIQLLRDYSELLRETSVQRSDDESSAYNVADTILAQPNFRYVRSPLSVDGGNLLKLDDGRCLTTRIILERNKDQERDLDSELRKVGGCTDVTFLEPLPGPVIEHVDMFVLAAGGKRLLISSYDLSNPLIAGHWNEVSDAEEYMTLNAALAMEQNMERLRNLGYEVIPVLSPLPRIPKDADPYYPTVLNAVVRAGNDGHRQVLLPAYKGYEEDIQDEARKTIEKAFGDNTEVVPIEAAAAARAQGAVHCVTITVPLQASIFSDQQDKSRRQQLLALKDNLDHARSEQMAAKIPGIGLQGTWALVADGDDPKSAAEYSLREVHFNSTQAEVGFLGESEGAADYKLTKPKPDNWQVQFISSDGDDYVWTLRWKDADLIQVTRPDGKTSYLVRENADVTSPFKQAKSEEDPAKSDDNTHPPAKKTQHHRPRVLASAATATK